MACMQVVLESPQEGRQYIFELNDRLIRDKELDGLTEIPVKPNTTIQQPEPDSDGLEELVPLVLPGQSLMIAIYILVSSWLPQTTVDLAEYHSRTNVIF